MDFYYTHKLDSDEPVMLIDRHVGFDPVDGVGIMGDQFTKELMALDAMGKKAIQVWINSPGGRVFDGYNIYNAILKTNTKVDTYCVGIAASIAGVIFQSGRNRIMNDYSLLMYHNAFVEDGKEDLKNINGSIATMIAGRSGKPVEDISQMMNAETWINAEDALANGFCSSIDKSTDYNKRRLSTGATVEANWKVCTEIMNSALPQKQNHNLNIINMSGSQLATVANALGLNPEASNEAIAKEITALKNKAAIANQEIENRDSKITDLQNKLREEKDANAAAIDALKAENKTAIDAKDVEIASAKNEVKEKLDKLKTLEEEREAASNTLKETNAKNLVADAVKFGRIKNEEATIKAWEAKAVEDLEGTKNLIESIPGNQKAHKIEVKDISNTAQAGSVVAQTMVDINNKLSKN